MDLVPSRTLATSTVAAACAALGLSAGCHRMQEDRPEASPRGAAPAEAAAHAWVPVTVAVGKRPSELAAGDLDGDGELDLVSADADDRTISVRLRRGGAWVAPPGPPLTVEIAMSIVELADVDRDRDLDVVATTHDSGGLWLWLGDGKGGLASAAGSPFPAFTTARPHNHGLVVGDLDGDGDPDAVVADQDARAAAALLGDGKGGFSVAPGSPFALGGHPYPPALGDVDRDGRLDLVVPLIDDQAIAVLLGDGEGGFAPAAGSPMRVGLPRPYGLALGDLDRDGALDVAAAHDDTDRLSVFLGDGRGGLREAPGSPVALGLRLWRMAAVDLDGDGAVDLVGAGSGSRAIIPGDGKGGFGRPALAPLGEGWHPIVADLDGDGRPDVAAADANTDVLRLWLSGRASAAPASAAPSAP